MTAATEARTSRRTRSKSSTPRKDRTAHRPLRPFTVDHFRRYARLLVLDNAKNWDPEDFQLDFAKEIFGGVDEAWLVIPEENGKTTFMGGFALYHGDYTPSASVPMAAASRDQIGLLFGQAAGFVERTPGLLKRFRVLEGYRRIECLRTGGKLQVYAADARTGDGVIPTLGLFDELHRTDMRLYRVWRGKLNKRDGQLAAISNAGEPGGEFEKAKGKAKEQALRVGTLTRKGAHTIARGPSHVLHEHALEQGDDLSNLKLVKKANPFSGVTVESLRKKRESPTMLESHWARMVCGVPTRSDHAAVGGVEWDALPESMIPEGQEVWLGLDLGWKWDTTAAVPFWLESRERRHLGKPTIIVPPRDGTATPPWKIRNALLKLHARNPVHTVVLDPNAGGEQLAEWIESGEGLGARVVAYSQANGPQALAFERFMEAIREGWLLHPHDATLTQQVMNAVARPIPGDRYRFDRPRTTRQAPGQDQRVIDALDAAAMVHSAAIGELQDEPNPDDYRIELL